jgi:aspartate carbamoyltransferase regulatory subunit
MNKKVIIHICAHDRFNYGDLMYGNILDVIFKKEDYDFYSLGLVEVDLSIFGGKNVIKIENIYKIIELYEESTIIIGGGEFLGAGYNVLESFISSEKINIDKTFSIPYIINEDLIENKNITIKYVSFGGLINDKLLKVIDVFNNVDGIYTRDANTLQNLNDFGLKNNNSFCMPDLVNYISDILDEKNNFNNKEDYVVFQLGKRKFKDLTTIINEVRKISLFKKVVLLPLGYCNRHEDYEILQKIKKEIPENVELFKGKNIYEITNVIKNSSFCIGSSLHLAIVSHSFKVKYLSFENVLKIVNYQNSWFKTIALTGEKKIYDNYMKFNKIEYNFKIDFKKEDLLNFLI